MTSSNGNIFRVTGPSCGEFTGEFPSQRPMTRCFDVFFDMRLNKRLSKQSWGWWYETPSRLLWRHCNVMKHWLYRPLNSNLDESRTKLLSNLNLDSKNRSPWNGSHVVITFNVSFPSQENKWMGTLHSSLNSLFRGPFCARIIINDLASDTAPQFIIWIICYPSLAYAYAEILLYGYGWIDLMVFGPFNWPL